MRIFFVALVCMLSGMSTLFAQDGDSLQQKDTTWKVGGIISLNFSQAYYENWQAGGTPSITGVGFLKLYSLYYKRKWRWDSQLDVAYGLIQERQAIQRKTDDKFTFDTKIGYDLGKKWFLSILGSFRTQFAPAYEDPDTRNVKISDFMSPAYVILSPGIDHSPTDNFTFYFSPCALKTTIVLDEELANKGAYGVQAGEWETIQRDTILDSMRVGGKHFRYEFGAYMKLLYKVGVWDNVEFQTKLELFANYLNKFGNIDVNWEGLLNMRINDFLSANIRAQIIYDDDIQIPTYVDDQGRQYYGARMQLKELFGLGLAYKF